MGLNQLAVTRMGGSFPQNFEQPLEKSRVPFNQETKLIEVSDGEDDDDDDDDDYDDDIDEEIDTDEDDDNESDEESKHDVVKVFKIDMNSQNQYEDSLSGNNLELDDLDEELDELDDELDDELSEVQSLSSKSSKLSDKLEETVYGKTFQEPLNISDLKTISINLEDPHPDSLDYKKLSLPKLRSIVSEKGLVSDASKLKKNELLKLLGAE